MRETGLTPAQEERLSMARRRRVEIQEDMDALRRCEQSMVTIRRATQERASTYREGSRRDETDFHGQVGTNYNNDRSDINSSSNTYQQEMSAIIERVSQRRTNLSNDLSRVTTTIRELERIAANGGS